MTNHERLEAMPVATNTLSVLSMEFTFGAYTIQVIPDPTRENNAFVNVRAILDPGEFQADSVALHNGNPSETAAQAIRFICGNGQDPAADLLASAIIRVMELARGI
jgi:hypothetical protein